MISLYNSIVGRLPGNRVLVAKIKGPDEQDSSEQRVTEQLKARDREVRQHEAAHSRSPELIKVGATRFDYTIGPDGKAYATGGKVTLSTGSARTPEEALSKAEALKKAAMAPGEPSSKDFQAMNAAVAMEHEARNRIYSDSKKNEQSGNPELKGLNLNIYA
ncbi:MAG TPA: putative metalloprotease CJM1_0395 family protein [Spirochaetota bacterium]|nr:putative metalloprotease CJM1_0395 family protein [Spirochaetota bacterium]HPJ33715.1 putative metalloprotease CJM1_0395 family protein [Spirochaetota bacterium]